MFFICVMSAEVPTNQDIWPVIGQCPDLTAAFMEFTKGDCTISGTVRTSHASADMRMRPYMFCMRVAKDGQEFKWPDLPVVVLRNRTTEKHDLEHTKQALGFMMAEVERTLDEFLEDVVAEDLEQAITSTGNGLLVLKGVNMQEIENAFHKSNRKMFKVIEGAKA